MRICPNRAVDWSIVVNFWGRWHLGLERQDDDVTLVAGGGPEAVALEDDVHRLVLSHVQLVARGVDGHGAGVHGVVGSQAPEVGVIVVPAQCVLLVVHDDFVAHEQRDEGGVVVVDERLGTLFPVRVVHRVVGRLDGVDVALSQDPVLVAGDGLFGEASRAVVDGHLTRLHDLHEVFGRELGL